MSSGLLIRGARQLLTLRGPSGPRRGPSLLELGIIPDGAVLIRDGVVQACGPSRQVTSLAAARNCEEADASGKVVMPAFVDLGTSLVHAHTPPSSLEGLQANYDNPDVEVFRDVLNEGARALGTLSSHSLRRRALATASGMMRHGTGTVESRAGYHLSDSAAIKVLRVQSELAAPPQTVSTMLLRLPPGDDPATWALRLCEELLPLIRRRRLASFVDLEVGLDSIPAPVALKIFETAAQLRFGLKIHADFFARESAVPLALRSRALSVGNLRHVTRNEMTMLGESTCVAILDPGVALQTGLSHAVPGRALINAGAIPGLASGYHPELSPGYNMQLILLLACRLYRLRPEEAIVAATINNAHAIRAEASVGSIEAGKQADLLVLNVSDYREIAYYAGVNIVEKSIKNGRIVFDQSTPSLIAA